MRTIFKLIILVSVFLSLQTSLLATVQFSDITVSNLTSSSTTISFFSDNSVSTNIEYGTDNTALTPASPSTNAKFHSFQLTNLASTTLYYFEITSDGTSYKDNGEVLFFSDRTGRHWYTLYCLWNSRRCWSFGRYRCLCQVSSSAEWNFIFSTVSCY